MFKLIQRDPDICNNCFRRVRTRHPRNFAVRTYNRDIWLDPVDLPDAIDTHTSATVPADPVTRGLRSICECGGEKIRPLSKSQMRRYAVNLLMRLEEVEWVDINRTEFWHTLENLKSIPDEQFRDDDIYRRAVENALNHDVET